MQNVRVVHVVESFAAGTLSFLKDLAHSISAFPEFETTIVYSDKRLEGDYEKIYRSFPEAVKFVLLPMEREISLSADLKAGIKLKKIIADLQPDILHLHSSKAGALGRLVCLSTNYKCKIFYSPHGFSFLRQDISPLKKKIYYQLEKFLQKSSNGITIACGDTEYMYAKKLGAAKLVRNGVRVSDFHPKKGPVNSQLKTVGTLGRIAPQRRPDFFNMLAKNHPDIRFVWIGDGPLKDKLTAPNIEVTGWINEKSLVREHLKNLDVYLQASAWEGLPIAVLEAMALGKPVIATDIIGNKDIVAPGETGYLFTTAEEFAQAVNKLAPAEERAKAGENARTSCSENFDSDKNMLQLIDIYRNN